jgi:putative DNA primase/helicase
MALQASRTSLEGKWADIYGALAPEFSDAMDAALTPTPHVPCPVHGGRDGFRLYKDFASTGGGVCNTCGAFRNGVSLLAWLRDVTTKQSFRMAAEFLEQGEAAGITYREAPKPKPVDPAKLAENRKKLIAAWKASKAPAGTQVEDYLAARLVWTPKLNGWKVRCHPKMACWDFDEDTDELVFRGEFPVMLSAVTGLDGKVLTLHRTYLAQDGLGKAPGVTKSKKMMKLAVETASGGAIQLMPASGPVLGVAEGIETALAGFVGSGSSVPVWACVSSAMLGAFEPPEGVKHLIVWADKDAKGAGETYSKKLKERMAERDIKVTVLLPDMAIPEGSKGVDWCDVLNEKGLDGFPNLAGLLT